MIVLDQENKLITLHTRSTTYQMKADQHNVLIHTYYGPRADGDFSYLFPGHPAPGVFLLRGGGFPPALHGTGAAQRQFQRQPALYRL